MKKVTKKNKIAVIYARYSSHNQNDMSIEQQVAIATKKADDLGLTVIQTYSDRAISGRSDNRPGFQAMLRDAESGRFSYLIAWKSSRIGRNMLEALVNESRLNDCGVSIIYVEETFSDNAAGRFAARSMMNVNQFYSEAMAEDIRRGLQANADQCKSTGATPYGFKTLPDKSFAIDENTSVIIQDIFKSIVNGKSLTEVARDLNERGIKTSRGSKWQINSFKNIVHNERYRGVYIFKEMRVEGGMPRIIDDDTYYAVQRILARRGKENEIRTGSDNFMLTGKLYCGDCGTNMIGISGTGRSKTYYYYTCRKARNSDECSLKPIPQDYIERLVAIIIREHILQPETMQWIEDCVMKFQEEQKNTPELAMLTQELEDNERSINNILDGMEQGIFTNRTKARLLELEKKSEEIKDKIHLASYSQVNLTREYVRNWLSSFQKGDIENRRCQKAIIDSFLECAYLYSDGRIRIVFNIGGNKQKEVDFRCADIGSTDLTMVEHSSLHTNHNCIGVKQMNNVFIFDFKIF